MYSAAIVKVDKLIQTNKLYGASYSANNLYPLLSYPIYIYIV